ncbi:MAG: hypothetical protein Q8S54_03320 [Bacteroidota bacterium]|nr:hypothetical protein [Odoribacter sp.]MDP3642203.1 hypothetical protein [Bacteroidota bacterium]
MKDIIYFALILFAHSFLACDSKETHIEDSYFKNQKISEAKTEFNRYLKNEFSQGEWKRLLVHKDNMIDNDFLNEDIIKDVDFRIIPIYIINSKKIIEYKNQLDFFKNLKPDTLRAKCHIYYNKRVIGMAFLDYSNNKWQVTDLISFAKETANYFNGEMRDIFFLGVKNLGVLYTNCFLFEDDRCYSMKVFNGEKIEFHNFFKTKYGSIYKMGIDNLSE